MKKILLLTLLLIGNVVSWPAIAKASTSAKNCLNRQNNNKLTEYAGHYQLSNSAQLVIKIIDHEMILRPLFWRSEQLMTPKNPDEFIYREREGRQITFQRNQQGCIESVKLTGFGRDDGLYLRLGAEPTPLQLLFSGQPELAAERMVKNNPGGVAEFVGIARQFSRNFPSKRNEAVRFLQVLAGYYPGEATIFAALADTQTAVGNRLAAQENFLKAFALNPQNESARRGLRRLQARPVNLPIDQNGWTVPFSLDEVFKKPTSSEIAEVEADWAKRDLSPREINRVTQGKINLGYSTATVHIISHLVHGDKHYGAIIVPDGLTVKSPVVLDLKGVSWDYFPLDLNTIYSPQILGPEQNKFIYVIPSFRGEVLKFNGVDYISEGDRTDSWDGATDDALALLNVALKIIPQADENRIGAFGKSRGGSVALLAGIRNPKIRQVLDWVGPTDWFELMDKEGWRQKEIVADGLLNKSAPNQEGGQFIERFILKAIEGKWNLHQVRSKMIADSPIYFVNKLPALQMHYGVEDEMVPVINGQRLVQKLKGLGRKSPHLTSFFHADSGHDLNQRIAFPESKKFLIRLLDKNPK